MGKPLKAKLALLVSFLLALPGLYHLYLILYTMQDYFFRGTAFDASWIFCLFLLSLPFIAFLVFLIIYLRSSDPWQPGMVLLMQIVILITVFSYVPYVYRPGDGNIVCTSNSPNEIYVKASQIAPGPTNSDTDFGTITLTNLSGGNISNVALLEATGAFANNTAASLGLLTSYRSGEEFTLTPDELAAAGRHQTSTITIAYKSQAGSSKSVKITCSSPEIITS